MDGEHVARGEQLALLAGTLVGPAPNVRRDAAAAHLRTTCSGAEVEVVDGGQPHYPFIVAAEQPRRRSLVQYSAFTRRLRISIQPR